MVYINKSHLLQNTVLAAVLPIFHLYQHILIFAPTSSITLLEIITFMAAEFLAVFVFVMLVRRYLRYFSGKEILILSLLTLVLIAGSVFVTLDSFCGFEGCMYSAGFPFLTFAPGGAGHGSTFTLWGTFLNFILYFGAVSLIYLGYKQLSKLKQKSQWKNTKSTP